MVMITGAIAELAWYATWFVVFCLAVFSAICLLVVISVRFTRVCERRRLFSGTGVILAAFALAFLPTVAKRSGTSGVSPVDGTTQISSVSDWESRHLGGDPRSNPSYAPRFTDITPTPTSVWLSAEWHPFLFPAGGWLDVLATHDLLTNVWEIVGTVHILPAETNVEVEVLSTNLPDGTNNCAFFRLDAHPIYDPTLCDTDGDGLTDEEEAGAVTVMPSFEWHDTSGATNLLDGTTGNVSGMVWSHDLFYPVSIAGKEYSRVSVDVNGLVYLVPQDGADIGRYYYLTDNRQFSSWRPARTNVIVAAYWDNLLTRTNFPTRILIADDVESQNTVVEFGSIGLYGSGSAQTNEMLSFQVVLSALHDDVIRVNYSSATTNMTGASATIGVMAAGARAYDGTNFWYNIPWSYNRRDAITPPMSIVYHVGRGTDPQATDTDNDGVSDGDEVVLGTDPLVPDTDGDWLTDGEECALGTDPLSPDTDEDGLPDGWENLYGLDPLSDEGDHGANGDYDGDGLSNAAELAAGTDPCTSDTDEDGLSDRIELGWVDFVAELPEFDLSGGTNLLSATGNYDTEKFNVMLPFPVMLAGVPSTNMVVCIDGCLGLAEVGRLNPLSTSGANQDLTKTSASSYHTFVAAYWDNLRVRANQGGQIVVADVSTNGARYCVVEWRDIGFSSPNSTTNKATFQVVMPQNEPGTVYVRYIDLRGGFTGASATLGVQSPRRQRCFQVAYNQSGSATNGMIVAYRMGTGSSPLIGDTDDDKLPDGEEQSLGTSAIMPDTDNDGLFDEWEVSYGLDPLSATEDNGTDGDPDGDGLSNIGEQGAGTDPQSTDTDNDGVSDGDEVGLLGTNPLVPDTDDDWLTDGEECDLGTDPLSPDTDEDGLPDGWENLYGLDPLSDEGDHGANGDYDRDGLSNAAELAVGTNPCAPDSDQDDIADGDEYGDIHEETVPSAWQTGMLVADVTTSMPVPSDDIFDIVRCVSVPLPRPLSIGGMSVSNIALDVSGIFYLGDVVPLSRYPTWTGPTLADSALATNAVVVAPYWASLVCSSNAPASSVRLLETGSGTNMCLIVEYANMRLAYREDTPSNLVSFQVSIPYGGTRRMTYRYADVGLSATGGSASIGVQSWRGRACRSYGHYNNGMVWSGLALAVTVGIGIDPSEEDSDQDGLPDDVELYVLGTDPAEPDTDGDGLDDGWEHTYAGFDPLVPNDATLDTDGDGLTDGAECEMGTNPLVTDTDGDGMNDGAEVLQDSDPGDATDGGQAGSRVKIFFYFGDHSGSHSEKYRLHVEPAQDSGPGTPPRSYAVKNAHYGRCETKKVLLKRGWRYDVRLSHAGTNLANADYDYTLRLSNDVAAVLLDDPQHLFCVDDTSSRFAAKGKVAALYVLDDPKVVPDYDRDGRIDSTDEAVYDARQTTFRFWINDDNDTGDINDSGHDRPGSGANGQNGKVDGRCDLLDFTPVLLDISKAFPLGTPDHVRSRVSWKLQSSVVNAVWTSLSASAAGSFHRTADSGATFGPNLSQNAHEATVATLSGGAPFPGRFISAIENGGGKGVVMIEGCASGSSLRLQGFIDGSQTPSFEGSLAIEISSVEDMYRWYNSRGLSGESVLCPTRLGEPLNMPDNMTSNRHLVFLHGASVSQADARAWAAEVFKRMWQSGMTAKFTAVTWRSNIGSAANYQENVSNAFFTASAIAQQIKDLPGTKVLMAHSLGNMVCSAMIQDYGLVPACYLMCNSAVPAEAYEATRPQTLPQLVHEEWEDYLPRTWAANWHLLFADFPDDDRRKLGWPGRFANVVQYAVNFYSTGDEVLELATDNDVSIFTGISDSLSHHSWHKQELFKGRGGIGGTNWAGWGFQQEWQWEPGAPSLIPVRKYDSTAANALSNEQLRVDTVFNPLPSSMTNSVIPRLVVDAHLAQGIPALNWPTGGCIIGIDEEEQFDVNHASPYDGIPRPNGWPVRSDYSARWLHSDMKDVAYFFNFKFYDKVMEKGNLK